MRILAGVFLLFRVVCFGQISFQAPRGIPVESPQQVLEADFNGDGRPDLLILGIPNIEVALNIGRGLFAPPQNVPYLGYPVKLAVADINHDGNTDIVVLESPIPFGPGTLLVYLGKGDGTFFAPSSVATLVAPTQIVLGDFNRDGKTDVAVLGENFVQVFPGLGNGNFSTPAVTLFRYFENLNSAAADFNEDGKLDIAVSPLYEPGQVLLLLGNGDGTFTTSLFSTSDAVSSLSARDLNNDGKTDLLLGVGSSVTPYFNDGTAHFTAGPAYAVPGYPFETVFADINHDGKLDIVVSDQGISVLLGNGDGTFQSAVTSLQGTVEYHIALARFDGTSQLDVAYTDEFSVEISHGDGNGYFVEPVNYPTAETPFGMQVGDFLDTGHPGVAIVENTGEIQVWPGEAGGVFGTPQSITMTKYYLPGLLAEGDFNGDGIPDIVAAGSESPLGGSPFGMQIFLGGAAGLQPQTTNTGLPFAESLAVGDFNSDGKQDVVYVGKNAIAVAFGDGQGNLNLGPFQTSPNYLSGAAVVDLNGDGIPDVVTGSLSPSAVVIWIGKGDGTFQAPVAIPVTSGGVPNVAVGDFNRDGIVDIAAAAGSGSFGQVCVLLGTGGGQFGIPSCLDASIPANLTIRDFNGDGYLDIASAGGTASVLLGNGDGTFRPAVYFGVGADPIAIGAADLNGDGRPDLIVANSGSDNFSVLLNTTRRK